MYYYQIYPRVNDKDASFYTFISFKTLQYANEACYNIKHHYLISNTHI